MSNQKRNTADGKIGWVPLLLSGAVLVVGFVNLYLNLPIPNLEVGMFPYKGILYGNTIRVHVDLTNGSTWEDMGGGYSDYNFTYQVFNSGKGAARNVNVSLTGEPAETFMVNSTHVFVGEPLNSNLLDVVHNSYQIGLLGVGRSYSFLFQVRLLASHGEGKFVLTVTSENAGTFTQWIVFE